MTPARSLPESRRPAAERAVDSGFGPRWYQGLNFKLLSTMLLLGVALAGAAAWLIANRVEGGLQEGSLALEQATHQQLAGTLDHVVSDAQQLALTLASLQTDLRTPRPALKNAVPALVDRLPQAHLIAAVGIWPEPASAEAERTSSVWVRDGRGVMLSRDDYNDLRTVPYSREAWYTPARYAEPGRCYWTPVYVEPLSRRSLVTCALALNGGHGFEGVATVSLDLAALNALFAEATADERGYALLLDRDGRTLALSAAAQKAFGDALALGRNVAELPQKREGFGPLALALHRRNEAFLEAALRAPRYDARSVSTLKDNTRELARVDAESALASLWNSVPAAPETLKQPRDPVFGDASYTVISELPGSQWQLASVTRARDGAALTRELILQTAEIALAAGVLLLLLSFAAVQAWVVRPLRRMTRQLAGLHDADTPEPSFDASSRDEIGALAHWQNERTRQLQEARDRARIEHSQLGVETSERQRAQDELAHSQERALQTLANVSDGVIYTDERGRIDHLNAAAERLTGVAARDARGQPLSTVLPARLGGSHGAALPNVAETVTERGARLDYPGGVFIGSTDAEREIRLAVAPLSARSGRRIGCVVVFNVLENGAPASERAPATPTAMPGFDPVTGLGDRGACERALRGLAGTPAAVAVLDIVRLADVNEAGGHAAGDEVLAQIAARLAEAIVPRDRVFRLAGDQLAMVLDAADAEAAMAAATELHRKATTAPFDTAAGSYRIDIVIGVHAIVDDATPAELLRRAGTACKAAKQSVTPVELWTLEQDPTAATVTVDDAIWVERIRAGLDRDLFHLTSQRIAANFGYAAEGDVYEILLALEDEEGFWAPPSSFLPVAERHGLTVELDRWVIRRTIEALESHPMVAARIAFVGINLSGAALADPQMLDYLAERFSDTSPTLVGKLCFELREGDIDNHPQRGQRFCEAMRALGCRVSIDRYQGRRTSDVQLLRRLPAALVKLDSRPYRGLADDEIGQMQAESQLRVLHHLGKRVIVTGLDDERSLAVWRKLGADYLQGYALAKPSPIVFAG